MNIVVEKIGLDRGQSMSTHFNKEHPMVKVEISLPSVVLDHVSQLNDELSFLVFLTALKGMLVFPAQRGFTVFTVDVSDSM